MLIKITLYLFSIFILTKTVYTIETLVRIFRTKKYL